MAVLTKKKAEVSPEEVLRRVAVLRRFRELLQSQRDRFREYLEVLDKQKDVIEKGSAEDLISHVELEEKIVADIFSIQKVIDPLEDMYRAAYPEKYGAAAPAAEGASEVRSLKTALEGLKTEAIVRADRNRALLSNRMAEIRSEIKTLKKNPYVKGRSVYGEAGTPALIDIQG
jgi:predicted phage gp36 major capsid-like protein